MKRQTIPLPHLHANDRVDEEEHGDEKADVGQGFEGLHEGPQENADGVALSQQLDEASSSEQLQETHVESVHRLGGRGERRGEPGFSLLSESVFM